MDWEGMGGNYGTDGNGLGPDCCGGDLTPCVRIHRTVGRGKVPVNDTDSGRLI